MDLVAKEESYAERRRLFKNIWDSAMQDDADIIKPKVIKTLRLDDMDKYVIGKSKKEKLKNLRTICNKILEFCDKQETDMLYEQIASEPGVFTRHFKPRKLKTRGKRKVKRHKTLFTSFNPGANTPNARPTTSEAKQRPVNVYPPKNVMPSHALGISHAPTVGVALISEYRTTSNPENMNVSYRPGKTTKARRRIIRKRRSKRKKLSEQTMQPKSGTSNNTRPCNAVIKGRAVLRRVKQVLAMNKIVISRPHSR